MCLKLNPDKFELIYFNKSSKSFLFPLLALQPPSFLFLVPSPSICSLGFILDSHLSKFYLFLSPAIFTLIVLSNFFHFLMTLLYNFLYLLLYFLELITVISFILVFLILLILFWLKFLILLLVWLLALLNFRLFLLFILFYIGFLWDIEWCLKYMLLCLKFTVVFLLSIWIT